jgi:PKD domain-containing protein/peptidase M28-like protein
MAGFWRSRGLYPARTLRFVIFDAEEQGLFGSFNYVDEAANGTLPDIVAMFNEEQAGIGYPLRFLGDIANPLMPTHIFVSPSSPNALYRGLVLSAAQVARNQAFAKLMTTATAGSFRVFCQLGYQRLTYHGATGREVWRPIFTPSQLAQWPIASDALGSSDQVPFTLAGIRAATIVGNFSYYSGRTAPAASYPYDQPTDTIGLMNTFADGGTTQSHALSLALAVPGMLTTWMLSQPDILGQVRPDGPPIAAIDSIGPVRPGSPVTFGAIALVPGTPHARLSYWWRFGDGRAATGPRVQHAYAAAGNYTLRLTVTAHDGQARVISQEISAGQPPGYANPYAAAPTGEQSAAAIAAATGQPLANPAVGLPGSRPGLVDQVGRVAAARSQPAGSSAGPWILSAVAVLVLAVAAGALKSRRKVMQRRERR